VRLVPASLRTERRARLAAAMAAEGVDILVIAGNPWRSDYLRYTADLTPAEGHVFAFIDRQGKVRVIAELPAEAARFRAEQTDLEVSWSLSPIEEAEAAIGSYGSKRMALAPLAAVPNRPTRFKHGLGHRDARPAHASQVAFGDRRAAPRRSPRR
jgi:hypothetical protein